MRTTKETRLLSARVAALLVALLALVIIPIALFGNPLRTLLSFKQVDDYPLFVMHFYGSYGFDDYLNEGIRAETPPERAVQALDARWACTVVAALKTGGDQILGRNFDWYNRPTLLLYTHPPDGYASVAMVDASYLGFGTAEAPWWDRFRLLEAPYWPFDGMNEVGLAVGMMAVPNAEPGQNPQHATIDSLPAIRLMLDRAGSVDEAISLLRQFDISFQGGPPLHYLVADTSGHSAVIEFVAGEMNVLRNQEPWQVATNFVMSGHSPQAAKSLCRRYATAYEKLEHTGGMLSQEEALALLEEVSQPITMWSVIYNMTTGDIQVAVGRQYDKVHEFNLELKDRHEMGGK
jgi:hypothetical protein